MSYIHKHRVRSAVCSDRHLAPAAAISIRPGAIAFPVGEIGRKLAGAAIDLDRAAVARRAGDLQRARDYVDFARSARGFLGPARLP